LETSMGVVSKWRCPGTYTTLNVWMPRLKLR
jgi:hypothetical protein